jgi:hypothetical protein
MKKAKLLYSCSLKNEAEESSELRHIIPEDGNSQEKVPLSPHKTFGSP